MSEGTISVRDIENLVRDFTFMSEPLKRTLYEIAKNEILVTSEIAREEVLRNMYNVYTIAGKFYSEELFKNGRLTFRDDNNLIYDTIIGSHITFSEVILFKGCSMAKGDSSSYILLNNVETPDFIKKSCKNFDFDKLVKDAISPPEISIVINIGYYPSLIENVLQLIK